MTDGGAPPQTLSVDGTALSVDPSGEVELPPTAAAASRGLAHGVDFTALYREHFAYVWRALRRLGIRDADLPDVTHDVFVVVHRKLHDFDPTRPAKPWLFGIAFRTALDKKRKHASFKEALVDDVDRGAPSSSTAPVGDEVVSAREAHDVVMKALDALDADKRVVFVMHELEGLSMPEIAEIVDAPLNTLYSRLRLARDVFVTAVRKAQQGTR